MTYRIVDSSMSMDSRIPEETMKLLRYHPDLFRQVLISEVHRFLIQVKRIMHLFSDVITIYSTLLQKVPQYDDITDMATRNASCIVRLEKVLNKIFGAGPSMANCGWEKMEYDKLVKTFAITVLNACFEAIEELSKCFVCIELFFIQFDNLRKLLIPCLMINIRIVLQSVKKSRFVIELPSVVDQIRMISSDAKSLRGDLGNAEDVTRSLKRESRILESVYSTLDASLQSYTSILLGKSILRREVEESESKIIARRVVCQQAAEHVLSIPLSKETHSTSSLSNPHCHLLYFISFILAIILIVIYKVYRLFLG